MRSIFFDTAHGAALDHNKPWWSGGSELFSLFTASLIILPTFAEKRLIEEMWAKTVKVDPIDNRVQQIFQNMLSKCVVIPWGVDHDEFNPPLQDAQRKKEAKYKMNLLVDADLIFGVVGRVVPIKNIEIIIDAFSMLKDRYPNRKISLVIFGGSKNDLENRESYMSSLKKRIKRKHNPNLEKSIIFAGTHDPKDIMAAIDCLISASFSESWGLSVTEAMATGIPTIVSDNTVMREVTDGTQLYFDPHKAYELTKHMIELIDHRGLQMEIGQNGWNVAQKYNWTETIMEILHHTINLGVDDRIFTLGTISAKMRSFPITQFEITLLTGLMLRKKLIETHIEEIQAQITSDAEAQIQPDRSVLDDILRKDTPTVAPAVVLRIKENLEYLEAYQQEAWQIESAELSMRIGDIEMVEKYIDHAIDATSMFLAQLPNQDSQQQLMREALEDLLEMKSTLEEIYKQRMETAKQIFPSE